MFPTPIEKVSPLSRFSYKVALPIALVIWLIPLLGVMMTALRGASDITAGNLWGIPQEVLLAQNMSDVFTNTPMLQFIINSFKINWMPNCLSMLRHWLLLVLSARQKTACAFLQKVSLRQV